MAASDYSLTAAETDARSKIGRQIVYWALTMVTVLGLAAIVMAKFMQADQYTQVKDILSMLLPMVAAWVGTVLAFYFSRENYAVAAQFNKDVLDRTLDQRLQSIPVNSIMISIATADNRFALRTPAAQVKLKSDVLGTTADKTGRNRILILDDAGIMKYVAHRSIIDKFVAEQAFAGKAVADLTLENLVTTQDYASWISSFGAVDANSTLAAVKAKMDADPKCSDVIVTQDGQKTSPAVGWITNVQVAEKAKL